MRNKLRDKPVKEKTKQKKQQQKTKKQNKNKQRNKPIIGVENEKYYRTHSPQLRSFFRSWYAQILLSYLIPNGGETEMLCKYR